MQRKSNGDLPKRTGLSVRYCFAGAGENDRELDKTSPDQTLSYEDEYPPPPHLPHPNSLFRSPVGWDLNRSPRLPSVRARRPLSVPGSWRGEGEEDPGVFSTAKVIQPPQDDVLSWDSSCSSSSSEEDIKDIVIDSVVAGSNNNYLWGSTKTPVPPSARNLSANRTIDDSRQSMHGSKKFENTFRLEPKSGQAFVWYKVKRPMVNIVDQLLGEVAYNAKSGPAVTRKLCEVIMKMAKKTFDWPRYKFVCHVTLFQLKGQGVMVADRALWNTAFDNSASYVFKNKVLVCVVTFHALYFE